MFVDRPATAAADTWVNRLEDAQAVAESVAYFVVVER
jgi:hypothetical protein